MTNKKSSSPAPSASLSSLVPSRGRRDFLGRASTAALWLGAPSLLVACGGGGEGVSGAFAVGAGADPRADGGIAPSSRFASIRAVEAACADLESRKLEPIAYLTELTAIMAKDPNYAETGFDERSLTAWGTFVDGQVHMVSHNFRPTGTSARSAAIADAGQVQKTAATMAAKPAELPSDRKARLMHSFITPFEGQAAIAEMSGWLSAHDYALQPGVEGDAHIATLRRIKGDGFFYINTHGGVKRTRFQDDNAPQMYSIQSSTLIDPALETQPDFQTDLAAYRLTYFTAYNGLATTDSKGEEIMLKDTRYGITAAFVDTYWEFAQDSVVIINACNSANSADNDRVIDFLVACHRKNAGLYLGWTEICSPPAAFDIPKYCVDRMLGANSFKPHTPKQRAFTGEEVITHMQSKGLNHDTGTKVGAYFIAKPNPRSAVNHILSPSIHHVEVDELNDRINLIGAFGRKQGKVFVDGSERQVIRWEHELVVCDLPRVGAGSLGPVWVELGADRSNRRTISHWNMRIDTHWFKQDYPGLAVDGPIRTRWRADVGPVRDACGEDVKRPVRYAIGTYDSYMELAAGGSFHMPPDCTITWSGQASFSSQVKLMREPGAGDRVIFTYLRIDPETKIGAMGLAMGAATGPFVEHGCRSTDAFVSALGLLDGPQDFEVMGAPGTIPLPAKNIVLGNDLSILGDGHLDDSLRLQWSTAPIESAPADAELI